MINIFQPSLDGDEIAILEDVFHSNWIGMGKYVKDFEKMFAESLSTSAEHFLATTSCSEGIFLSSYLFDFNQNDEIIAPSISFVAVGSCVIASGSKLVLCDVDERSCNVTVQSIEKKISKKTKAVILNHYGGYPCDMDPIMQLCRRRGIIVIEDSACAVKSLYKGKACGTIGDMGVWSFGPTKIICTGDGGMVYLRSKELVAIAKEKLYHGLPSTEKSGFDRSTQESKAWWEVQINRIGGRAIMNNIAGALGVAQMKKLDAYLNRRKEIFDHYMDELSRFEWLTLPPAVPADCSASYYFFYVQLTKRDALSKFLLEHDIYSTFRYWPLHRVKFFDIRDDDLKNSDFVSTHTLNLPLHQSLSDRDVDKIIDVVSKFGKLHY